MSDFDPTRPGAVVLFDEGAIGRPPNPNPENGKRFTEADSPRKSREALGVWFRNQRAWKIYYQDENQKIRTRIRNDLQTAFKANLPVGNPSPVVRDGLVSKAPDARPFVAKEGFAVESKQFASPWVFFSGQGTSEISKFGQEIVKISNRTTLSNILSGFQTAVQLKLSDPQGFINPTVTGDPVQFIDIHYATGTAVPSPTLQLRDIVQARLAAIPPTKEDAEEGNE